MLDVEAFRKHIANKAESWLLDNAPDFLKQETNLGLFPPKEFIQVAQYNKWEKELKEKSSDNFSPKEFSSFKRIGLFEAIEDNKKLIVLGDPGLGKTTSLYYLTKNYAENNKKPIPIYLELKYFNKSYDGLKGLIRSFAETEIEELKQLPLIFLLDGFNELEWVERREVENELFHLQNRFPENRWVVTSTQSEK